MTNNTSNSPIDFCFRSSSSNSSPLLITPTPYHHIQRLTKKRTELIKKNVPKTASNSCRLCGKKFLSPKALHGHMRCHPVPERGWRGVSPPRLSSNLMSSVEDHEMASCLLLLSSNTTASTADCRFECWSCRKVFGSHQALGGHRASHKNVMGCFAIDSSFHQKRVFGEFDFVSKDRITSSAGLGLDLNWPADADAGLFSSAVNLDLRLGL